MGWECWARCSGAGLRELAVKGNTDPRVEMVGVALASAPPATQRALGSARGQWRWERQDPACEEQQSEASGWRRP